MPLAGSLLLSGNSTLMTAPGVAFTQNEMPVYAERVVRPAEADRHLCAPEEEGTAGDPRDVAVAGVAAVGDLKEAADRRRDRRAGGRVGAVAPYAGAPLDLRDKRLPRTFHVVDELFVGRENGAPRVVDDGHVRRRVGLGSRRRGVELTAARSAPGVSGAGGSRPGVALQRAEAHLSHARDARRSREHEAKSKKTIVLG